MDERGACGDVTFYKIKKNVVKSYLNGIESWWGHLQLLLEGAIVPKYRFLGIESLFWR